MTGHTGFKGAWLSLWLAELGHEVHGLALDPAPGALFTSARLAQVMAGDHRCDIRDRNAVRSVIGISRPEVVVHLAAQPLVRVSYLEPRITVETNVMGTYNLLEALRDCPTLKATLVVTTDKVYRDDSRSHGYREHDPLGGHDPYSASKAMVEVLAASWAASFPGSPVATARAGNVIGGGDVSPERLLPDLLTAYRQGHEPTLRYPAAVRPWQHVLDCLNGYLTLLAAMLERQVGGSWNFGPEPANWASVEMISGLVAAEFGATPRYTTSTGQPHEATVLTLDSEKARRDLGWVSHLDLPSSVRWTTEWATRSDRGQDPREVTLDQLRRFLSLLNAPA